MSAQPRQEFKQNQGLFMSARMRQSIQILQLSNAELHEFLDAEVEKNPLLERDPTTSAPLAERPGLAAPPPMMRAPGATGDAGRWTSDSGLDDDGTGRLAESAPALRDVMFEQLVLSGCTTTEREIGAHLIAALDPAGRLAGGATDDIAATLQVTLRDVEAIRQRMMRFDPPGLFATSLRECLAAQLQERNRFDPAMARLLDNLDLLARHDLKRLRQACDVSATDLEDMIAELRTLDPKPGAEHGSTLTVIVPDILMEQTAEGGWTLELNPESTPRVVLNSALSTRMSLRAHGAERTYLNDTLTSANWLIRALQQRSMTILRVSTEILRRQEDFLQHGPQALQPLNLRTVAEALNIHESTVSRVTANKYVATPRGVLPLKFFFVAAMTGNDGEIRSNVAIQSVIRRMIQGERPDAVLSDEAISLTLRRQGIDIARRTVAKYREAMGFPNSLQRLQRAAETASPPNRR
ncbi:RNA polymerase, sigma 54 subunit, RpoN [Gluconacetobacter diazotrophicus PA1 5]|uniref:RNA polymerase sigma-54 factor n=1 Tax=Gluconacetobacter diazotrophicus TaxID=33996 RepID=A0A7W4NGM3_GLUDI|nr:RNA polymerase factor sigma-54 [Gluconacetobacter diazotrophicus]ACI51361.1 RNA polymerase, sigma 54 subunit, RpoN [Gluconacetobacter diazotrophicus PA1 5]MBB2157394.1 RNA polymerase factor sigma-54 [Gluconacetobacter diazotrophicus]TWB09909.1 RNA polymerase RpoN-/SigL-like sigma 54 subunit [Gluconacetobacter diazotrophicus]